MVPFRSVAGVPAVVDVAATGGAVVGPAMLLLDNSASSQCTHSFTLTFFEDPYSRFIPVLLQSSLGMKNSSQLNTKYRKGRIYLCMCYCHCRSNSFGSNFPILTTVNLSRH
jgi:hypothetical protein